MAKLRIFTWKDIYRVGKSVFSDVPETTEEVRAWTGSIMLLTAFVHGNLRGMQDLLEGDKDIRKAVYEMLIMSMENILKGVRLFPRHDRNEILKALEEAVAGQFGYVLDL